MSDDHVLKVFSRQFQSSLQNNQLWVVKW